MSKETQSIKIPEVDTTTYICFWCPRGKNGQPICKKKKDKCL